jgi:hypothetical protein
MEYFKGKNGGFTSAVMLSYTVIIFFCVYDHEIHLIIIYSLKFNYSYLN